MIESLVSGGLMEITKRFKNNYGEDYQYGANIDNEIFMMHPYCWCEKDDCRWCDGENPNFLHKESGFAVDWYKYISKNMKISNPNDADFVDILKECCDFLKDKN